MVIKIIYRQGKSRVTHVDYRECRGFEIDADGDLRLRQADGDLSYFCKGTVIVKVDVVNDEAVTYER